MKIRKCIYKHFSFTIFREFLTISRFVRFIVYKYEHFIGYYAKMECIKFFLTFSNGARTFFISNESLELLYYESKTVDE